MAQRLATVFQGTLEHIECGLSACVAFDFFVIGQTQASCSRSSDRIELQNFALNLGGGQSLIRPALELQFNKVWQLQVRCKTHGSSL